MIAVHDDDGDTATIATIGKRVYVDVAVDGRNVGLLFNPANLAVLIAALQAARDRVDAAAAAAEGGGPEKSP